MKFGGVAALAIAATGVAYALLVLRDRRHRDNLVFGALALVDSTMTAWRGLNVLAGQSILDTSIMIPCSIVTIVLALLTIEFIWGFPRQRPMPWQARSAFIVWGAIGAVLVTIDGHVGIAGPLYYAPTTVVIIALGVRAWRRTTERDGRIVIAMLWFRWLYGTVAYLIAPRIGLFEEAVWFETTVATTVSFVVIGTSVLRAELFSIRSTTAEVITLGSLALMVVLGGVGAVWAVQTWSAPGTTLQTALLIGATLVPLILAHVATRMYPRVERRVLAPLDERRARRLAVYGEPLPIDSEPAIEEATRRIAAIASHRDGGHDPSVCWQPVSELADDLRDALAGGDALRHDVQPWLPMRMLVPAIGGNGGLVGAFSIDGDGALIDRDTLLVARDLASRVATAVERTNAVRELDDAKRLAALGQFAAAIAHDIRTPLTSISLNVQILRRKLALSDDDREHLDIALEELARLDRSVAEILDFAKPIKLSLRPLDVGELIANTASTLEPVLHERNIVLRTEPTTLTVNGDLQRLRQVLVNLVDNAADASSPGTDVTVRARPANGGGVAIEVVDHGRGIGADALPRIFEPFYTTRPDGTGLGLAICHKVVRAHGGELHVRSVVGEGSTFTIVLPTAA